LTACDTRERYWQVTPSIYCQRDDDRALPIESTVAGSHCDRSKVSDVPYPGKELVAGAVDVGCHESFEIVD
jgi:hypothetical protein